MAIFQSVVDDRREKRRLHPSTAKKDMMDALMDVEDEKGRRLDDEEIIDILVMYLNAGHESSGHITMWATIFLQQHPEFFAKAKVFNANYHSYIFPEKEKEKKNEREKRTTLQIKPPSVIPAS